MLFSPKAPQTSETGDAEPPRRHSTTISMMEEEFGMREPPQAVKHFGLPSKLRILPPKCKRSFTQIPEPRRNSSYLKGSWETVWGCDDDDDDDALFVEPPPEEDVDSPSSCTLDYGGQEGGLCQVLATPKNSPPWSTDGEITPVFSSNFPSMPDRNALTREGPSDGEFLRISDSSPTEPHTSQ